MLHILTLPRSRNQAEGRYCNKSVSVVAAGDLFLAPAGGVIEQATDVMLKLKPADS